MPLFYVTTCYSLFIVLFKKSMHRSAVYTEVSLLMLKGMFLFITWQSFRTRNITKLLITNKLSTSVHGKDYTTSRSRNK